MSSRATLLIQLFAISDSLGSLRAELVELGGALIEAEHKRLTGKLHAIEAKHAVLVNKLHNAPKEH